MDEQSTKSNKTAGIVIAIMAVILLAGGAYYWFIYRPELEAAEKARLEAIAKEEAKKKREAAAARKTAKYEKLIEDADGQYEQEEWQNAKSNYAEASSLFPSKQYPQDQLNLVNAKIDSLEAQANAVGMVQTISSSTGRYYVVVSSSIDGDLANDYGNKMAEEGYSVKIIEPYSNQRFYRVSLADYDDLSQAASATGSYTSADGEASWVVKY